MKAYIFSSVDAHPLLHELERAAKQLPKIYSRAEVPHHSASTKIGQLHLSGTGGTKSESVTVAQHSEKILVATLDDDSSVDPADSRKRLTVLLGPLLNHYNSSKKDNLAPDDYAAIIFEDDLQKVKTVLQQNDLTTT